MNLRSYLGQAVAEFDAAMKGIGLRTSDPRVCECGCYEADHRESGRRCLTNYQGCRCGKFRALKPPAVNQFTTTEHYQRDRKGTWTGD